MVYLDAVRVLLASDDNGRLLVEYLTKFDGRYFERLADRERPDEFTARDLLAVTALSVTVPPSVADWALADAAKGDESVLNGLLHDIPSDAELGIDDRGYGQLLERGNAADRLWWKLLDQPGMGPTTVSKLMAAKRPHLIPIYDEVVSSYLRTDPWKHWRDGWDCLEDDEVRRTLEGLRDEAVKSIPEAKSLSLARVLDIVPWRTGQEERIKIRRAANEPDNRKSF